MLLVLVQLDPTWLAAWLKNRRQIVPRGFNFAVNLHVILDVLGAKMRPSKWLNLANAVLYNLFDGDHDNDDQDDVSNLLSLGYMMIIMTMMFMMLIMMMTVLIMTMMMRMMMTMIMMMIMMMLMMMGMMMILLSR